MFLRDNEGKWYEVDDKKVEGKDVPAEKVAQLVAEAKANARKQAAETLASLDPEVAQALQEMVASSLISKGMIPGQGGRWPGGGMGHVPGEAAVECWTADCWTAECWGADCFDLAEQQGRPPMQMQGYGMPQQKMRSQQMPRMGMPQQKMRSQQMPRMGMPSRMPSRGRMPNYGDWQGGIMGRVPSEAAAECWTADCWTADCWGADCF